MAGMNYNRNDASWKLMSGTFNGENNAALGAPLASPSGMIVPQYLGFLGSKVTASADMAGQYSNTAVGTLYDGCYQMVKIAPAAPNTLARGRLVFWDTSVSEDSYQVTNDETQNGGAPLFAGVLIGAPTAGNYCIIQTKGRATVQMRTTITSASRDFVWAAAGNGTDGASFDGLLGSTAITGANVQKQLAFGEAVASNAGLIIAFLSPMWFVERN